MRQIDIVVKTVIDRRPGGELRLRPDFQNGGCENVRRGMTQTLDISHLGALLQCLTVFGHLLSGEINHEAH